MVSATDDRSSQPTHNEPLGFRVPQPVRTRPHDVELLERLAAVNKWRSGSDTDGTGGIQI